MIITNTNPSFLLPSGEVVNLKRVDGIRQPLYGNTVSIEVEIMGIKRQFLCHTTSQGLLEAPAPEGLGFSKFIF